MSRFFMVLLAAVALAGTEAAAQSMPGSANREAGFGRAVAVVGNDVLIGEPFNETKSGLVYVYRKTGDKWNEVTALAARDAANSDGFGMSIASAGNLLIVGATRANNNQGAAYIFQRGGQDNWTEVARLVGSDVAPGDNFATGVALSGDIAVVAAPGQAKQTGAVYVFRRSGNSWTQEARLQSPEAQEQQFFGNAVAIMGNRILVGEPGHNERTGAVHVFERVGSEWKAVARFTSAAAQKNDRFGAPLFVDGDHVYVGATYAGNQAGAVHVFSRSGNDWREVTRYRAAEAKPPEQFGFSIAAAGNTVFIGAPRADGNRGAVYRFARNDRDSVNTNAERIAMPNAVGGDFYGAAISASGNIAAVAATNDDFGLGSVLIYENAGGTWTNTATLGRPDERIASVVGKKVECTDGKAAGFDCNNIELLSYLSVPEMGGGRGVQLNDIWGWTDPETGKEWAIVGRMDGTSFVDISNPEQPRYVGNLPLTEGANPAVWRDIKVYKDHAYIVADGSGQHGMQVFDLTRLRSVTTTPQTFTPDTTYRNIASAHNIVINEETGFAYAVGVNSGGETCGGGLHMIDIREPKNPKFAGCFADPQTGRANTGYSHDAQCVIYKGPDEQYKGREICLGANETMLSIADVTDKQNPKAISRASYPNVGYSHQGWLTEDHRFFYMDDELDELAGSVQRTRTIIWDLTDLDDPQVAGEYLSPTSASDHNLYIKGDTMYQSHYRAGLRVVDIRNRTQPVEIGYFDTVPYGTNTPGFGGSWSNYPYFKSGVIIATSGNEGLFVLKLKDSKKPVL